MSRCPECHGTGSLEGNAVQSDGRHCGFCDGTGQVSTSENSDYQRHACGCDFTPGAPWKYCDFHAPPKPSRVEDSHAIAYMLRRIKVHLEPDKAEAAFRPNEAMDDVIARVEAREAEIATVVADMRKHRCGPKSKGMLLDYAARLGGAAK